MSSDDEYENRYVKITIIKFGKKNKSPTGQTHAHASYRSLEGASAHSTCLCLLLLVMSYHDYLAHASNARLMYFHISLPTHITRDSQTHVHVHSDIIIV